MSNATQFLTSLLLCGIGLGAAGLYFLFSRDMSSAVPRWFEDSEAGTARRRRRRNLGMAIVAMLSVGTFLGVNLMRPIEHPIAFVLYWLVIMLLVCWLCVLAVVDMLHTLTLHRRWSEKRGQQALEHYLAKRKSADSRDGRGS